MTVKDIAAVPPIAKSDEMSVAYKMLAKFRKTLRENLAAKEWRIYVAQCLLAGEQEGDAS